MTLSKTAYPLIKLIFFIFLILAGLFLPILYKDVGCEFMYGGGDWNPLQSKILFQGFEEKKVDQTALALVNRGWKTLGDKFSPGKAEETEIIYGYELPKGFKTGKLHVFTKRCGNNGYVKVSVSSDQKCWKTLVEEGIDWRLEKDEEEKKEEWFEGKHDLPIPGKYLKDKLYIRFSGACRTEDNGILVEQWGIKVWKKQSLVGMLWEGIQRTRENTWKEGSKGRWINNRLRYRYHNIANEAKVVCESAKKAKNIIDGSPLTMRPVAIPDNPLHEAVIVFDFEKPRPIGKVGIFFWGDLHRATSYHATEYRIEILCNGEWISIGEGKDNREPLVTHYINPKYQPTQVKIEFTKAFLDHMVQVGEVYLYEREKVSLLKGMVHYLKQYNKSLPASFLYTFLFLIMLFFPGYCIAQAFSERILDEEDKFVFSFFFSIILYVIMSLGGLISKILGIYNLILLMSIVGFLVFLYKGWWKKVIQQDRALLIVFPLFLVFSILYQHHRDLMFSLPYIESYLDTVTIPPMPYYGYHADNLFPWRIAKVFLHHLDPASTYMQEFLGDRFAVFRRTPLLPLLTVPFLHVFGESHFIYQKLLTLLGGLFLLPIYTVIKRIFNKLTAQLTIYTILLNFFFFFLPLSFEVYYKYCALFPIFLILLLIEKRGIQNLKTNFLLGFIAAISFLIHPAVAVVYLISLFIYIALKFRSLKWMFVSFGVFFCVSIPWLLFWLYYHYKFSLPLVESSYAGLILDHTVSKTHLFLRLIGIFLPVLPSILLKNNLGLFLTLSPLLFIIFFLGVMSSFNKHKVLFLLAFFPCIILALPNTQYSELVMFGYYLLIPITLAFCISYIASIKRIPLRRIMLFLTLAQYVVFNLIMGKNLGIFFAQQIQFNHLKSSHIITYLGMLTYIFLVSFLILKCAFSQISRNDH